MVIFVRIIIYEFSLLKKYIIVYVFICISEILVRIFVLVKNVYGWYNLRRILGNVVFEN